MELWVRSQDKTALTKSEDIRLYYMRANAPDGETEIWLKDIDVPVGIYKTKERALEVLDEIQSKIRGSYILKTRDKKTIKDMLGIFETDEVRPIEMEITHINEEVIIYEMPEE